MEPLSTENAEKNKIKTFQNFKVIRKKTLEQQVLKE